MNTETSQKGSLCLCPCLHFALKYHKNITDIIHLKEERVYQIVYLTTTLLI